MISFRIKNFRLRLILTLRYWFHLPQDDIKEKHLRDEIEGLVKLNEGSVKTVASLTRVVQQLQLRLAFYETHISRMGTLRAQFEREQKAGRESAVQSMNDGVFVPSTSERPKGVPVPPHMLQ